MKTKRLLVAMIMACLAMTSFNELCAKTIYYVKVNGTGNGTSWTNAAGNIQDMIEKAVVGDEIWVASGAYYPTKQTDANDVRSKTFLMKNGVNLYGGFVGNETSINSRAKSDKDGDGKVDAWEFTNETRLSGNLDRVAYTWTKVSVSGQAWKWTVSGNDNNCYTVVTCTSEITNETLLDGFTVSDGNGKPILLNGFTGIYTRGKTVIQNCIVTNNDGYGILNWIGLVTNCYIYMNSWTGIVNGNGKQGAVVSNSTIADNSVPDSGGAGGILNQGGDIINCKVINNQAINWQANINNSSYTSVSGGGILNKDGGKVDKCLVMNNTAFHYNVATSGNKDGVSAHARGGGIFSTVDAVVSNSCVFNNKAIAIKNTNNFGAVIESTGGVSGGNNYNVTIVNNTGNGSEINFTPQAGPKIVNCITEATNISQIFVRPTSFTGITTTDAQLTELLNADWHLKTGTQYIDAGTLTDLPDWVINGTDLAGKPRTANGKISMGAYEYDPSYSSINELQPSDVVVFPNPANDYIAISGLQNNETLCLYNINGQIVLTRKATSETESIVVSHLPAGIYFVKTEMGQVLKWVKK